LFSRVFFARANVGWPRRPASAPIPQSDDVPTRLSVRYALPNGRVSQPETAFVK